MRSQEKDLLGLAESLVEYGRKKGADQIEISINAGTNFSVEVRKGEIEQLEQADSTILSLRVIQEQKVATASSFDFTLQTLHHLIDKAIERARFSSADEYAGLPEKEEVVIDIAQLKLYDPEILILDTKTKIELAKQTEAICLADSHITNSHGAGFSSEVKTVALANSMGFSGTYKASACYLWVHIQAGKDPEKVEDGWHAFARAYKVLDSPELVAQKALERTTRLLGARKVKTQNVPVVFEPRMTGELLRFLYNCISGTAIYRRQSFLVDKLDQKIGNNLVTVIDNGLLPGAPGTKPFDDEGVPIRKTIVIEKGILKNYLFDTYSARRLKMKSTGNASGPNNFHLTAGKHTPEEITKSVDKGLLLTNMMGMGLNPVTGDISRGAFGLWIEKGEIAYPVSEITISGNLAKILQDIEMVGNDLRFDRNITGPTDKIGEMTVGGI